jgi:peptidyl-prolyl cis-trans isomerase C
MSLKGLHLAGVLTAAALVLSSCGKSGVPERAPEKGDLAVAKVDGQTVWASEVRREAAAQGLIAQGQNLEPQSELFSRTLKEVVDQKLLAAEAVRRKLDKDPAAQRRLAAARERVLSDLVVEQAVAEAVTDTAVRGLYQEQLKRAKPAEEVRARQIVVATAEQAEALKRLIAAGAAFDALAMDRSRDAATRFNGGDLGYFKPETVPHLAAALVGVQPGQIVGPTPAPGGFALIKVEDRRAAQPITLQEARPQIVRFLTYDRIRDLLEKLRSEAKVETLVKTAPNAQKAPAAERKGAGAAEGDRS